jgi:hypothetical protein
VLGWVWWGSLGEGCVWGGYLCPRNPRLAEFRDHSNAILKRSPCAFIILQIISKVKFCRLIMLLYTSITRTRDSISQFLSRGGEGGGGTSLSGMFGMPTPGILKLVFGAFHAER